MRKRETKERGEDHEMEGLTRRGLMRRRLVIGSGVMFDSLKMSMSTLKCTERQPGGQTIPASPKWPSCHDGSFVR